LPALAPLGNRLEHLALNLQMTVEDYMWCNEQQLIGAGARLTPIATLQCRSLSRDLRVMRTS